MARNTPWHADGDMPFSRLRFEKDGHSFEAVLHTAVTGATPPVPGQKGEWHVTVDGVAVGHAPAHEHDWERSVYDLAIALWEQKRRSSR